MIINFLDTEVGLQTNSFIMDALRSVGATIDSLIYFLLSFLSELFFYICDLEFSGDGIVEKIISRIWLIIGVVMLFFLSFEIIKMIISPDASNSKNTGLTKLISRIVIAVLLLVSVNAIFTEARQIQQLVVSENVIGKILGFNTEKIETGYKKEHTGVEFSKAVFYPLFFDDQVSNDGNKICDTSVEGYLDSLLVPSSWLSISRIVNEKDVLIGKGSYCYRYTGLLSSVVGIFLCYVFINYIISVSTRIFQLLYLQIISPIPIISSVTEKGQSTLKKWGSQCLITYLDLFLRLFIIYLILFLCNGVMSSSNSIIDLPGGEIDGWIKLALVIGLLMFAKKAPDLIKELFPSSGAASGDFGLNLKKRFGNMLGAGVLGGVVGGVAAGTVGGIGAAIGNVAYGIKNKKNLGEIVGSSFAGMGSGMVRGMRGGYKNGVKGGIGGMLGVGAGAWTSASKARNMRAKGYGITTKLEDRWADLSGIKYDSGTTSQRKNEIIHLERELDNVRASEQASREAYYKNMQELAPKKQRQAQEFFDFKTTKDKSGKFTGYSPREYGSYASKYAADLFNNNADNISSGLSWDKLSDDKKQIMIDHYVSEGDMMSKEEFDKLSAGYDTICNLDTRGYKINKQITDIRDDLDKNKPSSKS